MPLQKLACAELEMASEGCVRLEASEEYRPNVSNQTRVAKTELELDPKGNRLKF